MRPVSARQSALAACLQEAAREQKSRPQGGIADQETSKAPERADRSIQSQQKEAGRTTLHLRPHVFRDTLSRDVHGGKAGFFQRWAGNLDKNLIGSFLLAIGGAILLLILYRVLKKKKQ